jgi:phosphoenolpyruvate-protein phosphotransferase
MKPLASTTSADEALVLDAPLSGWAAPLDEAPDPVFAGRMLGDGVALDPVSESLHAPCDGVVIGLPRSRHAVTLRAHNGAEILLHVGLETVALGGEGFEAHVAEGQRVRRGDRLLSFDLDLLAGRARSLLTPVVLTNGERFEIASRVMGREVRQGEPLMTLRAVAGAAASETASGEVFEADLAIALPHGLHARPAARLAACARRFEAEIKLSIEGRRANVRSPVSVMTLGAANGQTLHVIARGADGPAAVAALRDLLTVIAAEEAGEPPPAVSTPAPAAVDATPGVLRGVMAAPGLAIGVAVRLSAPEPLVTEASRGAAEEANALGEALVEVALRLRGQAAAGGARRGEILAAHQAFLEDPVLRATAERHIAAGRSAGAAWRQAVDGMAETLRGLADPLFAERADDLKDLERQVLFAISGEETPGPAVPDGAIVVAEELLPSQLIALEGARVAGFCTVRGGATSHVAILAAAMGVPALAALGPELLRIGDGTAVILDADAGVLRVAPDEETLEATQQALARRDARRRDERAAALAPCTMADGTRVEVFANLGHVAEAAEAVLQGAEGCGLFRTEFLYLERRDPPGEDEQAAAYQTAAEGLEGRPLTVRTLDAGGDKPLAFAPSPHEPNPALGLRGVRASLRAPDLLRAQLRAILRVTAPGERRILLPMVSDIAELRAVREMLHQAAEELKAPPARLGVMIETPASALLADRFAEEADFLSIGTNDLTQYVLAMDREHPELASRLDALHPAVLRLIARVADAAGSRCPVSLCGGLASDPLAAPLLVGLGVRGLSAAPFAIPAVKATLGGLGLEACRAAAREALTLTSAEEVRGLLRTRFADGAGT